MTTHATIVDFIPQSGSKNLAPGLLEGWVAMGEDEGYWTSEGQFLVPDWGDKVHYDKPMP